MSSIILICISNNVIFYDFSQLFLILFSFCYFSPIFMDLLINLLLPLETSFYLIFVFDFSQLINFFSFNLHSCIMFLNIILFSSCQCSLLSLVVNLFYFVYYIVIQYPFYFHLIPNIFNFAFVVACLFLSTFQQFHLKSILNPADAHLQASVTINRLF